MAAAMAATEVATEIVDAVSVSYFDCHPPFGCSSATVHASAHVSALLFPGYRDGGGGDGASTDRLHPPVCSLDPYLRFNIWC